MPEYQNPQHRASGVNATVVSHSSGKLVYVLVNFLFVFFNLSTNPDRLWFLYALGGWGAGLVCHWFAVFVGTSLLQRMTDREMEKGQ